MSALDHLKARLHAGVEPALARPWAVEATLDKHIAVMEKRLRDGSPPHVPRELQDEALRRFWSSQRLDSFREARLVSFGVAEPFGPQRLRVIEDRERFPVLLDCVDQYLPTRRQFRRCYQGLLSGYFGYDPIATGSPPAGRDNWNTLRTYLRQRSSGVIEGERNPQWAEALQLHGTLFDEEPCARYGAALLAGDRVEVDQLRQVLGISETSWFMRKLYLAQVQAAVAKGDSEFQALLGRVLELLQDNKIIRDEGLRWVLDRHASLRPPPLAIPLREAAVAWWGNPWLQANAAAWGGVTPEARTMVTDWLKLEFIEAFFTLLAEERTGDSRRLKFWSRYVHAIEDIHFALGPDARDNPSADFKALRKKMTGLVVPLMDNVRTNNAFIMRMGPLVIVEFSGYSNACYGYDAQKAIPFRFDRPVVLPKDGRNSLKHTDHALWLAHQDGVRGFATWEERFEAVLAEDHGVRPKRAAPAVTRVRPPPATVSPRPAPAQGAPAAASQADGWESAGYSSKALSRLAEQLGLSIDDQTNRGGNLWVRCDDSRPKLAAVLRRWGFQYKDARKGWWRSGL